MQFGYARLPKICDFAAFPVPRRRYSAGRSSPADPPDSLSRECENGFHFRIDDTRLYWRLTAHAGLDDCPGISPQNPFLIRRFDSE